MEKDPQAPAEKKPFMKEFFGLGGAGQIIIAAAIAIGIGVLVNSLTEEIPPEAITLSGLIGALWIKALKAVVLPMIISSLIVAMLKLRALPGKGTAKLMGYTLTYYVFTTLMAVILGLITANFILIPNITPLDEDAIEVDEESTEKAADVQEEEFDAVDQVIAIFTNFIPQNIINAMATNELLAVIVTACVIGLLIPTKKTFISEFAYEIEEITSQLVWGIIMAAPVGIFFLLLPQVMRFDLGTLAAYVGILLATQIGTMGIQWAFVYPTLFVLFVRANPFKVLKNIFPALITAFGTASSAATLPVTNRCAEAIGVPEEVRKFSLPLGMTINMDGSAIHFPTAIFWMQYAQGGTLSISDMVMIAVTATLSSVGTAPIPSASLVLLVMIANTVGVNTEGIFALIVAIDWISDRFRTVINVTGDLYGCAIMAKLVNIEDLKAAAVEDIPSDSDNEATEQVAAH